MLPPSSLSGLSRAALEALLVELFGEISGLKHMNSELRAEIARLIPTALNFDLWQARWGAAQGNRTWNGIGAFLTS